MFLRVKGLKCCEIVCQSFRVRRPVSCCVWTHTLFCDRVGLPQKTSAVHTCLFLSCTSHHRVSQQRLKPCPPINRQEETVRDENESTKMSSSLCLKHRSTATFRLSVLIRFFCICNWNLIRFSKCEWQKIAWNATFLDGLKFCSNRISGSAPIASI